LEPVHLLVLGGNRLNIPAIREAKNNGFFTYVADKNPHAAGFEVADVVVKADIANAVELYQAISGFPIQGIVTMAEAGVMTAATISEKLGLNGIGMHEAARATSKAAMREAWKDSEYSVGFFVVSNEAEMTKAVHTLGRFPLIMKPDKTFGGSRGVSRVGNMQEAEAAYRFARDSGMNGLVVVEHCAEGNEFSCEVIIDKGATVLLCIGEKVKSPFPYRVDCSVQYPARLSAAEEIKVQRMCGFAVEKLGIKTGVAHIEFAYTTDGPRLFELGVRCGGGHTPVIAKHVSGINEFVAYASIACGLEPVLNMHPFKKGADYRFLVFPPGKVEHIRYSEELIRQKGVLDFVLDIADGSEIKPLQTTANRSGCVVTTGEARDEAVALADQICSGISVEYADQTTSTASHFFQSA